MCCNFEWLTELGRGQARIAISGSQIEELPDETDLTENIIPAHPSNLPLSDHVHRLISLNRSPGRLELSKSLLGVYSAFDRSMVLFQDIVQVLHRSVPTTSAQDPFLLYICDARPSAYITQPNGASKASSSPPRRRSRRSESISSSSNPVRPPRLRPLSVRLSPPRGQHLN